MRPQRKLVATGLIAVALVYALTVAARNGLADLYAEPAETFLQDTRASGGTLTETEWLAIEANLLKALNLAPDDPSTLTELGRLHRIQLEADTLALTEVERYGNLAIGYYEEAARLRPAWPWGWSNLALMRYELYQDTSDAYYDALIHATHFGPWEAQVQRLVVDLGLDTWGSLSPDARRAVLGTIDRALVRQPLGLAAIIDSDQAWQMFCEAATADVAANELTRLQGHCENLSRIEDEI